MGATAGFAVYHIGNSISDPDFDYDEIQAGYLGRVTSDGEISAKLESQKVELYSSAPGAQAAEALNALIRTSPHLVSEASDRPFYELLNGKDCPKLDATIKECFESQNDPNLLTMHEVGLKTGEHKAIGVGFIPRADQFVPARPAYAFMNTYDYYLTAQEQNVVIDNIRQQQSQPRSQPSRIEVQELISNLPLGTSECTYNDKPCILINEGSGVAQLQLLDNQGEVIQVLPLPSAIAGSLLRSNVLVIN